MESNEQNQSCKKRVDLSLLKHLALQLFDFGSSTGSLITSALGIFKTFQKITAPISFYKCFSHETSPFFSWATNIINIFADFFKTNQFDYFELYTLYCLIFPIVILMFITFMYDIKRGFLSLIACFFFLLIGAGFALFFGFSFYSIFGVIIAVITFFIIVIGFSRARCKCCRCCDCCKSKFCLNCAKCFFMFKKEDDSENVFFSSTNNDENNLINDKFIISRAFYPSSFILYLFLIPLMNKRAKFLKITSFVFVFLYLIVFPLNILIDKKFTILMLNMTSKLINFLVNCLSMLIIPATNAFVELMAEFRMGEVHSIMTYIFVSLIFPIVLINYMIKYKHPSIYEKYKKDHQKCCKYAGIEVWDILKQMVYAVLAAFDISEYCMATEFIWILIIVIKRPFRCWSDPILSIGNSLVAIISNAGIVYVKYT